MQEVKMHTISRLKWLWVSVAILIIDQITKQLVIHHLSLYESIPVTPFFNLTFATNRGAAFSFLNNSGQLGFLALSFFAVLVILVMVAWLYRLSNQKGLLSFGISLVIGGACGNLIDRIIYGHVVDFLDFYIKHWHWPAFNIADSAIVLGAFILMTDFFKTRDH